VIPRAEREKEKNQQREKKEREMERKREKDAKWRSGEEKGIPNGGSQRVRDPPRVN